MARRTRRQKAEYPIDLPEIDDLPWLDLRQISGLSGFPISTLQMQVQRGVYPWIKVGQQGVTRRFEPAFALHLMICGSLCLGWSVPIANASVFALDILARSKPVPEPQQVRLTDPDLKAIIGARPQPSQPMPVSVIPARSLADIERALGDQLPDNLIMLDIAKMVRRLTEAAKIEG